MPKSPIDPTVEVDEIDPTADMEEGTQVSGTPMVAEPVPETTLPESSNMVDTENKDMEQARQPSCDAHESALLRISRLPDEFKEKLTHYDKDGDGTIDLGEMLEAANDQKHHQRSNKRLWYVVVVLGIVTISQAWMGFGMSFWAVNLAKESKTVMSDAGPVATATDGESIMRMAPATVPNLALEHAIVMDMEHLRTIEEITYTYIADLGGRHVPTEISEKVMSVARTKEEIPTVIIETLSNRKLVLEPGQASLKVNNVSVPMCGKLKCGSFKVNDPALDKGLLDAKLLAMLGEDAMRRLRGFALLPVTPTEETCGSVDCCAGESLCSGGNKVPWTGDPNVGKAGNNNQNSKFKKTSGCCNPVNKGGTVAAPATKAKCCQAPSNAKWFDSSKRAWAQVPQVPLRLPRVPCASGLMCNEDANQNKAGKCTQCGNENKCGKYTGTSIPKLKHTCSVCAASDCTCKATKAECDLQSSCEWNHPGGSLYGGEENGFYCKKSSSTCGGRNFNSMAGVTDSGVPAPSWGNDDDWW